MRAAMISTAFLALVGAAVHGRAQAQCVECSQQMLGAALQNQSTHALNQSMRIQREGRQQRSLQRSAIRSASPTVGGSIADRTEEAVMAALNPEFERRVAQYGKRDADQWLITAARAVGGQVGALASEYQRRIGTQGRVSADSWYVATARQIGQDYVREAR